MSNSGWWANKLGGTNAPSTTRQSAPTAPPQRQPIAVSPAQAHRMQVEYDEQQDALTTKAQNTRYSATCPECQSGNYMSSPGSNYSRCYDCGYPVMQSGSGAGMPSSNNSGPVTPAKQLSTQNNFNPNQIIGRIE